MTVRPDAVAIYVRWSTEEQGEGTTLEEQLDRCRNYVLSQGWRVNGGLIFIDDGCSGANLERPALTRLRERVDRGEVDCVVSLKIDRLSRSLVDCVELVLREWAGRCFYKSVSQPVNTTDELGRVFFAILAGFAEYERALIRERTFSGLLRRVAEGAHWGSAKPPYGYTRVGRGRLAVSPAEADVVRYLFRLAAGGGLRPEAISGQLNREGIPGPGGRGWWPQTVRSILRNPIYAGRPEYGRRQVDRRRDGRPVVRRREAPLVVAPERRPELALVSDAEFAAAGRVLRSGGGGAAASRRTHLLTGLARCRCGARMQIGYDRLGRRHYRCQHASVARGGRTCSAGGGYVYAHCVEPVAALAVRERYAVTDPHLRRQWEAAAGQGTEAVTRCRRRLAEVRDREHRLEADLGRILRQARQGEITIAEKRAFEADLAAEQAELARQRAALEQTLAESAEAGGGAGALLDWAAQADPFLALPPPLQRELLCHLLDRVVIFRPRGRGGVTEVDLYWRCGIER